MNTAEVLEGGLAVLRERGMAKGALMDDDGRVCARGAIALAVAGPVDPREWGAMWDALWRPEAQDAEGILHAVAHDVHPERSHDEWGCDHDDAVQFNNHPETTQADVEGLFEEAIKRSREGA